MSQPAAGKVLMHFAVSVDGFVAGPGHDMSFAPVLLGDGIRLYDALGGHPLHLRRDSDTPTQTVDLRYQPIGRGRDEDGDE
jgi:hypothetical protein